MFSQSLPLPKPEGLRGLRVQVEQGWNEQVLAASVEHPWRGNPVLSHATARTSQTQPPLCVKLVPADENALKMCFCLEKMGECVFTCIIKCSF